jgi:hypothetical protein
MNASLCCVGDEVFMKRVDHGSKRLSIKENPTCDAIACRTRLNTSDIPTLQGIFNARARSPAHLAASRGARVKR